MALRRWLKRQPLLTAFEAITGVSRVRRLDVSRPLPKKVVRLRG